MAIRVRPALFSDIEWLMEQLRDFDRFAGYKHSLFGDEAYARGALKTLVGQHVCFIAEDEGRCGFIAGYKMPHLFNPRISVLTESFWWVAVEHRGCGAGLALLNEFEAYGRRHCDWTIMTLEHNSPINSRNLTKRGFLPREQSYILEV